MEGSVTPPRETSSLLLHSLYPTPPSHVIHSLALPSERRQSHAPPSLPLSLTATHTLKQKHLPPIHPSFSFHSQLSSTHQQPPTNHTNQTKPTNTPTPRTTPRMAPAWTPLEDRALLLALIQSMAPEGPSKHQFEAAVKAAGGRWTFGAVSYVIPHHTTLSPILRRGSRFFAASRSRLRASR